VLGERIALPVITAPFVGSTFVHPEGEIATARGANAAGTISSLSRMGSLSRLSSASAATAVKPICDD